MNMKWSIGVFTGTLLACSLLLGSAWAQSTGKPLNLALPPSDVLASSSTAPLPARASSIGNTTSASTDNKAATGKNGTALVARPAGAANGTHPAPGVYYGDTSGHIGSEDVVSTPTCDDSKYNEAQVHGSVSTGVVSGNRIGTGSYSGGEVTVSKAFGDCDHPSGGISISIGGSNNNFNGGRGYRRGY